MLLVIMENIILINQYQWLLLFAYSDNIYAVKTHLFLGEDVLVRTMKRVGVKEK